MHPRTVIPERRCLFFIALEENYLPFVLTRHIHHSSLPISQNPLRLIFGLFTSGYRREEAECVNFGYALDPDVPFLKGDESRLWTTQSYALDKDI